MWRREQEVRLILFSHFSRKFSFSIQSIICVNLFRISMFDALTLIYNFISSYNSGDRKIGSHVRSMNGYCWRDLFDQRNSHPFYSTRRLLFGTVCVSSGVRNTVCASIKRNHVCRDACTSAQLLYIRIISFNGGTHRSNKVRHIKLD